MFVERKKLPRLLLLLAIFVFLSANTVHFVETSDGDLWASTEKDYFFDFDDAANRGIRLNLKSAIAVDYSNGDVVYARNADTPRPIASLTKLMTAMVVIDNGIDLSTTAVISKEDARRSSRSRLRIGYELTLKDLLYAALLSSDNRAARTLARSVAGSYEAFASLMNSKARSLGLKNTVFFEPTGLDERNVSTAHEVARLLHYALDYKLIERITTMKRRMVRVVNKKNKQLPMANTNLLIHQQHKVLGGKTGYIRESDYCLATTIRNRAGKMLTVVVLGVPGDKLRFRECRRLADWAFQKI